MPQACISAILEIVEPTCWLYFCIILYVIIVGNDCVWYSVFHCIWCWVKFAKRKLASSVQNKRTDWRIAPCLGKKMLCQLAKFPSNLTKSNFQCSGFDWTSEVPRGLIWLTQWSLFWGWVGCMIGCHLGPSPIGPPPNLKKAPCISIKYSVKGIAPAKENRFPYWPIYPSISSSVLGVDVETCTNASFCSSALVVVVVVVGRAGW